MDWIKQNFEKALLALISVILIALAVLLMRNVRNFTETFSRIRGDAPQSSKITPTKDAPIDEALQKTVKPAAWTKEGSLFVSRPYIYADGLLIDPLEQGNPIHEQIPNVWFLKNNLDILNSNILSADADADHFSNLEEHTGQTDPQDPKSHPPLLTKVHLQKVITKPFRTIFSSYEGDTFAINTIDVRNSSTQFLKLGDEIQGTPYKISEFEKKSEESSTVPGLVVDVSELTIQNTETGAKLIMVVNKMVNSPDSFAIFRYDIDGKDFRAKKDEEFVLKPEELNPYKVIDISTAEAVIEHVKTKKQTVLRLQK